MRALRARRDGNGHVQHLREAAGFLRVRLAAEEEPGDGQANTLPGVKHSVVWLAGRRGLPIAGG